MSGDNDITLRISGDESDAARALKAIRDALKGAGLDAQNVSKQSTSAFDAAGDSAKRLAKDTSNIGGFARQAAASFTGFAAAQTVLGAVRVAMSTLRDELGKAITLSSQFNNAFIGLDSIARAFGAGADAARAAAVRLSSDGLMKVSEAASGLKNLLASGFSLDQATTLMERFKDSAAFARQGSLEFGQAVVAATEGIKNGNSTLVDNAGVTKNLSVILSEAGMSAQDLGKASTDAKVRLALFQGIVRETNAQVGDAARLAGTYSGAVSRLKTQYDMLLIAVGDSITQNATVAKAIGLVGDAIASTNTRLAGQRQGYSLVSDAIIGTVRVMASLVDGTRVAVQAFHAMEMAGVAVALGLTNLQKQAIDFATTYIKTLQSMPGSSVLLPGIEEKLGTLEELQFGLALSQRLLAAELDKTRTQAVAQSLVMDGYATKLRNVATELEATRGKTVEVGQATGKTSNEITGAANALVHQTRTAKDAKAALDALGGIDFARDQKAAIDAATKLAAQVKALGGVARLTEKDQDALNKAMHAAVDAMVAQGRAGAAQTTTFRRLAAETEDWAKTTEAWGKSFLVVKDAVDGLLASAKKASADPFFVDLLARGVNPFGTAQKGFDQPEAALPGGIGVVVKTDIDRLKEIEERTAKIHGRTTDWHSSLQSVSQAFGDLAQIGGKGLDGLLGQIARMVGLMATASQAGAQLGAALGKGTFTNAAGQQFSANFAGFRNAQGEFTAGNVAAGSVQAGTAIMGGVGSISQATSGRSRGSNVMGGMAAGASMGANPALLAATGGWSVVVGAAIGAIVGAVRGAALRDITARVRSNYAGTEISEDLSKKIRDTADDKFKKGRHEAEIYHTADIIREGGGVKASNAVTYSQRTRDAFVMLKAGTFSVEDTRKVVDENFGELAAFYEKTGRVINKEMRDIIRLNAEMGVQSETVKSFVVQQAATMGSALERMLGESVTKFGTLKDDIADAKKDLDDRKAAGGGRELGVQDTEDLNKAQAKYDELLAKQQAGAVQTQAEFDRVGRMAVASLNAGLKSGMTYDEVLEQIGGGLSSLVSLQENLGITTENRVLKDLINEQKLTEQYADRVDAVKAANEYAVALVNLNGMTAESYADVQAQAMASYQSLNEAGFSQESILRRIAPQLQVIRQEHIENGREVDEGTQKLIDQAEASDLLGGKSKTSTEIMTKGFEDLNLGIGALIETLGGKVPDALKTAKDKSATATKDMKDGFEKVEGSAKNAGDAAARIGDKVKEAAERGAGHWRKMIDDANEAADAVDGVSFGHSPGGLKEIVPMLRAAESQMRVFARNAVGDLTVTQRVIDRIGLAQFGSGTLAAAARGGATATRGGDTFIIETVNASAIDTAGLRELVEDKDGLGMLILDAIRFNRRGMQTAAREILGIR